VNSPLTDAQRSFALHRIMFGDMLSLEMAECLRRASLACAENHKSETGVLDFFCALHLQNPKELSNYFQGDIENVVREIFPKHRYGRKGLFPQSLLDELASSVESSEGGYGYLIRCTDELIRLLWLGTRLANAVGRKASFKDIVAALTAERGALAELQSAGLKASHDLADFEAEVETIVFHTTPHTGEGWPRHVEFEYDGRLRPPFTMEVSTPSGPFAPVRFARIKLNGSETIEIAWPDKPNAKAAVTLSKSNKLDFEIDGPQFGSMEVTLRGTPS
jgi:hypothetical protein